MGVRIREIRSGRKFSVPKKLGELLVKRGKHEYHTTHMVSEDPSKPATSGAPGTTDDESAGAVGPPAPAEPVTTNDDDHDASVETIPPPVADHPVSGADDDATEPAVPGKRKRKRRRRAPESEE